MDKRGRFEIREIKLQNFGRFTNKTIYIQSLHYTPGRWWSLSNDRPPPPSCCLVCYAILSLSFELDDHIPGGRRMVCNVPFEGKSELCA